MERLGKRFVTEGLEAALYHRPQPRPDKVKVWPAHDRGQTPRVKRVQNSMVRQPSSVTR